MNNNMMFGEKISLSSSIPPIHTNYCKISVILPIYNVENYLKEALDSLVNQTLKDIEFICINDGSTDNSLNILNAYAENDARFTVISQENQGQGVARNKGVELAKGEYIVFLDPDDKFELNAFDELYNFAKEKNANVIQFNYTKFEEYSKNKVVSISEHYKKYYGVDLNKKEKFHWLDLMNDNLFVRPCFFIFTRMYSTAFIKKYNIKCSPTRNGEDVLFVMQTLFNADEIYYLDKSLYLYRKHSFSITSKKSRTGFDIFTNIKYEEDFLKEKSLLPKLNKYFKKYEISRFILHYKYIPNEYISEYLELVKKYLTNEEYKKFKNKIKNKSFFEQLFSVKNKSNDGKKYKVVTILGIEILFLIKHI